MRSRRNRQAFKVIVTSFKRIHRFEIVCLMIHVFISSRACLLNIRETWLEKRWNSLGNRVDFEMNITDRSLELFIAMTRY